MNGDRGNISSAQKTRKDFQPVKHTSGKDYERLTSAESWGQTAITRVPETGYPVIGADIRGILTQYSSRSVVSSVEGTHRNRTPLSSPRIRTVRWLKELEKRPVEIMQVNHLAATLAAQVNIPTGGTTTGEEREFSRRKLFFELFKKMLIDLRETDIHLQARDGNPYAEHSIGYHEASREIDAATNHPKDMSQNIGEELLTGNEQVQNPVAERRQIGQNMLSSSDVPQPATHAFLGRQNHTDNEYLMEREEDQLALDNQDREEDFEVDMLMEENEPQQQEEMQQDAQQYAVPESAIRQGAMQNPQSFDLPPQDFANVHEMSRRNNIKAEIRKLREKLEMLNSILAAR